MPKKRRADAVELSQYKEANGEDITLVRDVLDVTVRQKQYCKANLWFLITWLKDDLPSSKLNTNWVTNQFIAENLLQRLTEKFPEKAHDATKEITRRNGGRPKICPEPMSSTVGVSSTTRTAVACEPTVATAFQAPADYSPSTAVTLVNSVVTGRMIQFLSRNESCALDDKETWLQFQIWAELKRSQHCSIDTLLQHAQSDSFRIALSLSKQHLRCYEPEDPKTKNYTRCGIL
jgi:hypothetical protein